MMEYVHVNQLLIAQNDHLRATLTMLIDFVIDERVPSYVGYSSPVK